MIESKLQSNLNEIKRLEEENAKIIEQVDYFSPRLELIKVKLEDTLKSLHINPDGLIFHLSNKTLVCDAEFDVTSKFRFLKEDSSYVSLTKKAIRIKDKLEACLEEGRISVKVNPFSLDEYTETVDIRIEIT